MNTKLIAAAILAQIANAAFTDDLSAVKSAADDLGSKVSSWSSADGLQGALGIQQAFPTLSKAVDQLKGSAGSVSDNDITPDSINSFVSSIKGLLNGLTTKADDIKSTGAGQIVSNDLNDLSGPSSEILDSIVKAVKDDCAKVSSLTGALNDFAGAFSKAIDAYQAKQVSFAGPPDCKGSGGGSSAAGSSAGSSAAETSGSPTGGASSAAATSKASSAASSGAAAPPPAETSKQSSVATSNNGAKAAAGLAAIGAGAVALLI